MYTYAENRLMFFIDPSGLVAEKIPPIKARGHQWEMFFPGPPKLLGDCQPSYEFTIRPQLKGNAVPNWWPGHKPKQIWTFVVATWDLVGVDENYQCGSISGHKCKKDIVPWGGVYQNALGKWRYRRKAAYDDDLALDEIKEVSSGKIAPCALLYKTNALQGIIGPRVREEPIGGNQDVEDSRDGGPNCIGLIEMPGGYWSKIFPPSFGRRELYVFISNRCECRNMCDLSKITRGAAAQNVAIPDLDLGEVFEWYKFGMRQSDVVQRGGLPTFGPYQFRGPWHKVTQCDH